jgi:hypothetical protein
MCPIICNNPACDSTDFKASVLRKECNPKFPYLVVKLNCAHCRKEMKVWVVNPQLKEIYAEIGGLAKLQNAMLAAVYNELHKINEPNPRKRVPFMDAVKKILKL